MRVASAVALVCVCAASVASASDIYFGQSDFLPITMEPSQGVRSVSGTGLTYRLSQTVPAVAKMPAGVVYSCDDEPCTATLSCASALPLLCLQDIAAPAPDRFVRAGWSAGLIAQTPVVRGDSLSSPEAADALCRSQFGKGWRMASVQDGSGSRLSGYGSGERQSAASVWIGDRTGEGPTCW